jgi:hypothetical protein
MGSFGSAAARAAKAFATCILLSGCAAYADHLQERFSDRFGTQEQRDAADSAACQRYGATPGTDVYVNCMVSLAQNRAIRNSAASNSGPPPLPGLAAPVLSPAQQPTNCRPVPYSAQNSPYGMTSYRCQ